MALLLLSWRARQDLDRLPPLRRWQLIGLTLLACIGIFCHLSFLVGPDCRLQPGGNTGGAQAGETAIGAMPRCCCIWTIFSRWCIFFFQPELAANIVAVATTVADDDRIDEPATQHPRCRGAIRPNKRHDYCCSHCRWQRCCLYCFRASMAHCGGCHKMPARAKPAGDSMSPGNIAALSQSADVAFRVQFKAAAAKPAFIGAAPVLTRFDGRSWLPGHLPSPPIEPVVAAAPSATP